MRALLTLLLVWYEMYGMLLNMTQTVKNEILYTHCKQKHFVAVCVCIIMSQIRVKES